MSQQSVSNILRAAGLRVTAPRQAVFAVLAETHEHLDAEAITQRTRAKLGKVSHQTVYDVLAAFQDADLVRCLETAGMAAARYELQRHDNHHHMVCRKCHRIEDVPCQVDFTPCMHPLDDYGFTVETAEVVYRGICANCQDPLGVAKSENSSNSDRSMCTPAE